MGKIHHSGQNEPQRPRFVPIPLNPVDLPLAGAGSGFAWLPSLGGFLEVKQWHHL